ATGTTRVFHNGILDATGANWYGQMRVTEIGRGDAGSLRGAIDELAIYDRALTEEELAAHALAR
ncbi:MAG: LamG-like jellyroll fold domain-containing protein, partial [Chloroflexota bacterium]